MPQREMKARRTRRDPEEEYYEEDEAPRRSSRRRSRDDDDDGRGSGRSRRSKKASNEPEHGWQNIVAFPKSSSKNPDFAFSGVINFKPEFLDYVLELVVNEEIEIDDDGYISLNFSLFEKESKQGDEFYGGNVEDPLETLRRREEARRSSRSNGRGRDDRRSSRRSSRR